MKQPPKPSWQKSSSLEKDNFVHHLDSILQEVEIKEDVVNCKNVHCKDPNHIDATDDLILNVLESVEKAAGDCLHQATPPKDKKVPVPGWSMSVKPFKDTAFFWHQVWRSAGKPINTELHRIMKNTRNIYHYHIRKCKKAENAIRRNKLLDACLNGNGEIFKEIKKMRKSKPVVATSMDGTKHDVEEHFKNIYKELYNSVEDEEDMNSLFEKVNSELNFTYIDDVMKVTPDVIKEASSHLKDGKSDPTHSFSSDCIKNGPSRLFYLLSVVMKSFLIHSHVTLYLLLATLVPIIKDKLASISISKNYRSIAISSLFLKLFDWVTLTLFGEKLGLDELQFAYQEGASTTMCTWSVIETIGYFLRNDSEVFTCQTDMTKAFDMIKHSLLFQKLLQAGLSKIFLRLLMVIYLFQYANVRWNGVVSNIFTLCNGVRQGAILSGILYCFYVDNLFKLLRSRTAGCWVNNNYHGMFGYSDDNWVLAPTLSCLKEMMQTIEEYCNSHNLKFSTDPRPQKCKTKCIAYLKKPRTLPSIYLCGNPLPWVTEGIHLGNNICNLYDGMARDIRIKRATYISKNCDLVQEFFFSHPKSKLEANKIFNSHFTGSPIWDLFSPEAIMLENTWNVSFRRMYDLPMQTHRYLVEPVSGQEHVKKQLIKRFLSFIKQIEKSKKMLPIQLLNVIKYDTRSITGCNIRKILLLLKRTKIEDIKQEDIENLEYAVLEKKDGWRVDMIKEISDVKCGQLSVDGFSTDECEEILRYACTS